MNPFFMPGILIGWFEDSQEKDNYVPPTPPDVLNIASSEDALLETPYLTTTYHAFVWLAVVGSFPGTPSGLAFKN